MNKVDFDIITILQVDADMPLSQLSRRVGISKTALWNRLQRLEERGIIKGKIMALDRQALDLAVVVFFYELFIFLRNSFFSRSFDLV